MGDSAPARNDLRLSRKVTEQNKRSGMAETAAFRDKTMETAENVHLTEEEIADLKERIQQEIFHIEETGSIRRSNRKTGKKKKTAEIDAGAEADVPQDAENTASEQDEQPAAGGKWNMEIYRAAHSGDKELYGLASVLAFYIVRPFFAKEAKKYQNSAKKPEIDDFMNDLYVAIFQMLKNYNPEFTPITWIRPWHVAIFQKTKQKESGIPHLTHYSQNRMALISRAVTELEIQGNPNPNDYQIYKYLSVQYPEKEISLATIARCRAMNFKVVTADTNPFLESPDESLNPEKALSAKEQSEQFERLKKSLSKSSQLIIDIEHEYIRQYGDMPDVKDVAAVMFQNDPSLTEDIVARMVNSAHQELKRTHNRMKARILNQGGEAEKVTVANTWRWDDAGMEEEEKMLMQAISEDPSWLLDPSDDQKSPDP